MKKIKIIILAVIAILIFGGILGRVLVQKAELPEGEFASDEESSAASREIIFPGEKFEEAEEIFGFTGTVLEVNLKNNFLIIKSERYKKEFKAVLSEDTQLMRTEIPAEAFEQGRFTPIQTAITLSDFKPGDYVSLRASENIAGKTEFNQVIRVFILP